MIQKDIYTYICKFTWVPATIYVVCGNSLREIPKLSRTISKLPRNSKPNAKATTIYLNFPRNQYKSVTLRHNLAQNHKLGRSKSKTKEKKKIQTLLISQSSKPKKKIQTLLISQTFFFFFFCPLEFKTKNQLRISQHLKQGHPIWKAWRELYAEGSHWSSSPSSSLSTPGCHTFVGIDGAAAAEDEEAPSPSILPWQEQKKKNWVYCRVKGINKQTEKCGKKWKLWNFRNRPCSFALLS